MTGKTKDDEDLYLSTPSGAINDPKKCAIQFAHAFHTKVERLRSQSAPNPKSSLNVDTIPKPTLDIAIKLTKEEIRNKNCSAKKLKKLRIRWTRLHFSQNFVCGEILIALMLM